MHFSPISRMRRLTTKDSTGRRMKMSVNFILVARSLKIHHGGTEDTEIYQDPLSSQRKPGPTLQRRDADGWVPAFAGTTTFPSVTSVSPWLKKPERDYCG